ncbi:hypothetical protein H310_12210 [Aphanomyces invadans]|uniref:Uncharacterized protein n=1 Tax=Aphanomyces invadans TaxID=157072 RepID=A0A024TIH9_9STRA|nr:hypothetical protein H310_12210 [Aphanomyces invadans]ETV93858.1 hypothetical protein H310_12210 [Aphanomyces invadans]|eukprot:XP_008877420.1 hypothetical protein H310_12210 [Aphanomyces invadans]
MSTETYSASARSLISGPSKRGIGSTSPTHNGTNATNAANTSISTVGGFYVSVMESAKASSSSSQGLHSPRPKQRHDRMKASSLNPCISNDGLFHLDAMGLVMHSAEILKHLGVERGDVDGIVTLMRSKPQEDRVQVVCVHELLYVLRHDPSDYTLQTLMTDNITPFLLKLVREFRFHTVLQTDIMHVMLLLAKLAVEHAQVLVRESAGALIAKTMALHPNEERLTQYATSLLQTLRTMAVSTGAKPGKPSAFEIAYFSNDSSPTRSPAALWAPATGESSCTKHHASPLEPFQLVSAKSQALAERSRTPELSHSRLRRVLSSPKVPTLTANGTTLAFVSSGRTVDDLAPAPLLRPESCPTFDQLTIEVTCADLPCKPSSSQSTLRRKNRSSIKRLTPMVLASPTLGAYRSSPLFVEPIATAKRVDATHGKMKQLVKRSGSTGKSSPGSRLTAESSASSSAPAMHPHETNNEVEARSTTKPPSQKKFSPTTLRDHRAAKCLQRYFRRILKVSTPQQLDNETFPVATSGMANAPPQHPDDDASLDVKLIQRDENEYLLRTVQASFCRGLHLHSQYNYDAAREAYESALDIPTSNASRISSKFRVELIIRVGGSFASVVVNVGATYLSQGQYDKALEAFELANAMHPHHPKAMYNAGLAHWHLGRPDVAASLFTSVLATDPSHAKAIFALHLLRTQFHVTVS